MLDSAAITHGVPVGREPRETGLYFKPQLSLAMQAGTSESLSAQGS
jgi:hypothetical protein